jgi:hypothetical protein
MTDAPAALAGRDEERDPRVAPLGVEPAVPGHLVLFGHPPPFVGDRLSGRGSCQPDRRQLHLAEQALLYRHPSAERPLWST